MALDIAEKKNFEHARRTAYVAVSMAESMEIIWEKVTEGKHDALAFEIVRETVKE